jgi:hypothetical protein
MPRNKNIQLTNPIEKHFDVITPYHYYFFFLVFFSKLPVFWHVLNLIFLSPPMDYSCNSTETNVEMPDTKNICPCVKIWWNRSIFTETMQTKFDLACDKEWLISFSHSIAFVGTLIGAFLFGFLSDR